MTSSGAKPRFDPAPEKKERPRHFKSCLGLSFLNAAEPWDSSRLSGKAPLSNPMPSIVAVMASFVKPEKINYRIIFWHGHVSGVTLPLATSIMKGSGKSIEKILLKCRDLRLNLRVLKNYFQRDSGVVAHEKTHPGIKA